MSIVAMDRGMCRLARLEWDSAHFGFDVGRVDADATDEELRAALHEARRLHYRLVYWATTPDRGAPPWVLFEFNGRLVDRKVTFARPLARTLAAAALPPGITVERYPGDKCSEELINLAVAAGAFSRFAIDPRTPPERFHALYRIWIERSVAGEIADAVLVARGAEGVLAGMVTVKVARGVGNIGLIAVDAGFRARGVAAALIAEAHRLMVENGAEKATVVTQSANAPACRLYQRAGYQVEQAENYYHFWPLD